MGTTQSGKLKHLLQKMNFHFACKGSISCQMKEKTIIFNSSFCYYKALWEAGEKELSLNSWQRGNIKMKAGDIY